MVLKIEGRSVSPQLSRDYSQNEKPWVPGMSEPGDKAALYVSAQPQTCATSPAAYMVN